jgi:hypothetical protein
MVASDIEIIEAPSRIALQAELKKLIAEHQGVEILNKVYGTFDDIETEETVYSACLFLR